MCFYLPASLWFWRNQKKTWRESFKITISCCVMGEVLFLPLIHIKLQSGSMTTSLSANNGSRNSSAHLICEVRKTAVGLLLQRRNQKPHRFCVVACRRVKDHLMSDPAARIIASSHAPPPCNVHEHVKAVLSCFCAGRSVAFTILTSAKVHTLVQ